MLVAVMHLHEFEAIRAEAGLSELPVTYEVQGQGRRPRHLRLFARVWYYFIFRAANLLNTWLSEAALLSEEELAERGAAFAARAVMLAAGTSRKA